MADKILEIPVTILTGFLGSGKTTFLNNLMSNNKDKRYAIIENEYGKQGVDSELIIRPEENIVELNNGCLCCSLNDGLYDILEALFERRDDFDEIIIEATGLADPSGIAQPFIAHPLIKKHFPLKSIVCLIDCELIEDQLQDFEEPYNQIAFSDILLINKIDLVDYKYLDSLETQLKRMNPLAQIYRGQKDQFPLFDQVSKNVNLEKLFELNKQRKTENHDVETIHFESPHYQHEHKHTDKINSVNISFDTPFDYEQFCFRMSVFLSFQSKDVFRIKGLIWLKDRKEQYIFQSVGKRFDVSLKRDWYPDEEKNSYIVFIGRNLKKQGLEKMLSECLALPSAFSS